MLQSEREGVNEDVIQRELVKLTITKANILGAMLSGVEVSNCDIEKFRIQLKDLSDSLPEWMNSKSLLIKQSTTALRRAVMYYHLFFLSAMQLLLRLPMAHLIHLQLSPEQQEPKLAVREGLLATKLAARLLSVMGDEGIIIRICWMCMLVKTDLL
jgi:hypothetical protein